LPEVEEQPSLEQGLKGDLEGARASKDRTVQVKILVLH
jgi:hypothetical protein